jgi:hypothetical protein
MSSLQQRIVDITDTKNETGTPLDHDHDWTPKTSPLSSASTLGEETPVGELKPKLFRAAFVVALLLAMTGWVYALGWVALKLIV